MRTKNKTMVLWIAIAIGVIVIGVGVNSYTSRPAFCASCHEGVKNYETWHVSSHNKVHCLTCHADGLGEMAQIKAHLVKGMMHTISHLSGAKGPVKAEKIGNVMCMQCHKEIAKVEEKGDIRMRHAMHLDKGVLCVDCHARVVHSATAQNHAPKPRMEDCFTCHRTKAPAPVDECAKCHLKPM